MAGLVAAILCFIGMDVTTPINCQAWVSLLLIFSYLSLAAASLLIVLRIIAIWNKNKIVMVLAIGTWGINVGFLIQAPVRLRSAWVSARVNFNCGVVNARSNELTLISMAITDIILLLTMAFGLLRLRRRGGGTFGLTRLLWKQGVIWILLATVAEIPPAVFLALNLNNRLDIMFQPPSVVTMTIAATRMHRSLVDFTYGSSDAMHKNDFIRDIDIGAKPPHVPPIPRSPMEISVRTVFEQHLSLQVGDHEPPTNTNEGVHNKLEASSLDEDVERRAEKFELGNAA